MPSYDWVCHKCKAVTPAEQSVCSSCRFPAEASGKKIERATLSYPLPRKNQSLVFSDFALFFPEILFAGLVVIVSPVWALVLLLNGHVLPTAVLAIGISGSSYVFIQGVRRQAKYLAYIGTIGSLLTAYFAYVLRG